MSTHSAECSPHTCHEVETSQRAPSMNAMRGRTLIRKTSLLRKIEPIARRSSFANRIIYNPLHLAMNERRNDLEIMNWIPQIALRIQNSDRSPLYDVRNPASDICEDAACEVMFSRTIWFWSARLRSLELRRGSLRKKACRAEAGVTSEGWWSQTGSNRRPHACKARALPAELWPRTRRRMLAGVPSRSSRQPARLRPLGYGVAAFVQEGLPSRSCRAAKAGGPGKT